MATIKITCSCGAVMETEGGVVHCGIESDKFLKNHELCRKASQPDEADADCSKCDSYRSNEAKYCPHCLKKFA